MATVPKFRIDVDIHNLLMNSSAAPVKLPGYNDARVIKFVWTNLAKNRMKGGARSFED